jgi:hypothetical protein
LRFARVVAINFPKDFTSKSVPMLGTHKKKGRHPASLSSYRDQIFSAISIFLPFGVLDSSVLGR